MFLRTKWDFFLKQLPRIPSTGTTTRALIAFRARFMYISSSSKSGTYVPNLLLQSSCCASHIILYYTVLPFLAILAISTNFTCLWKKKKGDGGAAAAHTDHRPGGQVPRPSPVPYKKKSALIAA